MENVRDELLFCGGPLFRYLVASFISTCCFFAFFAKLCCSVSFFVYLFLEKSYVLILMCFESEILHLTSGGIRSPLKELFFFFFVLLTQLFVLKVQIL